MVYFRRGRAWSRKSEFRCAIQDYEVAIKLNPNEAIMYDCLAWILATCPSDELCDGTRAVELAIKACELTEWRRDAPIYTLAAAYAEAGNFEEAVKRQQHAINLLDDGHPRWYEEQLELYKNHKPYRLASKKESPGPGSP